MVNPEQLPLLDVKNVETALKELDQAVHELHGHLIAAGIDHLNKIAGDFSDSNIFHLRDNILYRIQSLRFHLLLLLRTQYHNEAEISSDSPLKPMLMDKHRDEQMSVFESIVFHACSLFDYLGNIIDYVAGGRKRQTLQWSGAVRAARDRANPLSGSPLAVILDKHGRQWVDKLYKYRVDIIHFKADPCDVTYTHNVIED